MISMHTSYFSATNVFLLSATVQLGYQEIRRKESAYASAPVPGNYGGLRSEHGAPHAYKRGFNFSIKRRKCGSAFSYGISSNPNQAIALNSSASKAYSFCESPLSTYQKVTSVCPAVRPIVTLEVKNNGSSRQNSAGTNSSSSHSRRTVSLGSSSGSTCPPDGSHDYAFL